MLTLAEVLTDVAASPGFKGVSDITIDSRGVGGESPLHWMAVLGDPKAIQLLVDAGADINAVNDEGNSPLHVAVKWRQADAASLLITRGANPQIRNRKGNTPAEVARSDAYEPTIALFPK